MTNAQRIEELLKYVDLWERRNSLVKTFSGGMKRRLEIARGLLHHPKVFFLDEPTTGLHFADVDKLLGVLQALVNQGNTVLVIEHNLDVVKTADYVIDLGPDGGDEGGEVVASGTPEELVRNVRSYTGQYLREVLK